MNISIFSITRDRLQYTKDCFAALREKAGHPYDHYVYDNGSDDDTCNWLIENQSLFTEIHCHQSNIGISKASNYCLRCILAEGQSYDLVIKCDNDCMIQTTGILAEFARIYSECKEAERWVLSPRVEGINKQPRRVRRHTLAGHEIGVTPIVGGLFHVVPAPVYRHFMADGGYDESLPKGWGQDDQFCDWLARNGYAKGYVEDLVVEHYEGTDNQAKRWPDYFTRKFKEMER
jgi:glycosyltransferase involved in cell wall biosynthesis